MPFTGFTVVLALWPTGRQTLTASFCKVYLQVHVPLHACSLKHGVVITDKVCSMSLFSADFSMCGMVLDIWSACEIVCTANHQAASCVLRQALKKLVQDCVKLWQHFCQFCRPQLQGCTLLGHADKLRLATAVVCMQLHMVLVRTLYIPFIFALITYHVWPLQDLHFQSIQSCNSKSGAKL